MLKFKAFITLLIIAFVLLSSIASFGETINYSYDSMLRLIRAEYGDGTVVEYVYDNLGNRLQKSTTPSGDIGNIPPNAATNPNPANNATDVITTPTLTWTGNDPDAGDAVAYYIYLGTTPNPPFVSSGLQSSYTPERLKSLTTYYWKVVSRDSHNAETTGPNWSFKTKNNPPSASFTASTTKGTLPLTVKFTDTSVSEDDEIVEWEWDFDNNGSIDSTVKNPTFTYSSAGIYTVKLTVKDVHGASSSEIKPNYIEVYEDSGGTINGDIHWDENGPEVYYISSLTVPQGSSLTISPGRTIKLLGEANISVSGKLIANGVTFTAKDQASPWGGIYFSGAESSQSRLEGCIFNFANGYGGIVYIVDSSPTIKGCTFDKCGASCGISIQNGSPIIQDNTINGFRLYGICVEGSATPTVTGNTVTNNQYGIYVNGGGTYQGNTITGNTSYGIYVNFSLYSPVFSGNTYANNVNGDLIKAGTIQGDVQWVSSQDDAYALSSMTIPQGASLTIASGQTIKLLGGANISVSGKLIANGVTFTAKDQASPWGGIYFISGAESSQSRLEGCIFNFANGYGGIVYIVDSSPTIKGCTFDKCGASCGIFIQKGSPIIQGNTINGFSSYGIYVEGSATPTVTGNTVTNNQYGIYVNGGGTYQGNTITGNTSYGIYVNFSLYSPVFSGNTYANNVNGDLIKAGTIQGDVQWVSSQDDAYTLSSMTIPQGASLTIASGQTIKLLGGANISVSGKLIANGVTFTAKDQASPWGGIYFSGAESSQSRLEGCIFNFANGYGSIVYIVDSSPTIKGCTFDKCGASCGIFIQKGSPIIQGNTINGFSSYGIYVEGSATPTVTGNTVTNNQYGIYVNGGGTYQGNTITGNTSYGIYVNFSLYSPVFSGNTYANNVNGDLIKAGTIQGDVQWVSSQDDAYALSSMTIPQGASLTIASGQTIKLLGGANISVSGKLIANGVTFTAKDQASPWGGIYFSGAESSQSRLEGCIFNFANGYGGILYMVDSSPTIKGCTLDKCGASYGISIQNGSPIIQDNTINGFSSYGIYVAGSATPTVTGNTITNNQYGIYVNGGGTYQGNTITGNTSYGIYVNFSLYSPVFSGNTYANNVNGDLIKAGTIQGDVQWVSSQDDAYALSSMTIPQGASLTIASGQTIKLLGGANISVSGKLIANGLTFTAKDQASPWGGIYFSGAESSQSRLEGCIFNFANGYGGIVYIVDSSPTIKGCTFDKCGASCGIFIQKGSPIIQDNTINRFSSYGIYVEGSATPTVTGNTITNNLYGIYVNGGGTYQSNTIKNNSNYGLYYTGTIVIDATHCNWGDPSGPYDPSDDRGTGGLYNPYGKGDRVSDHVMYDLMGYQPVPGDVNHDGVVDLVDTVLSLQVLTGRMPAEPVYADADINNDGRLGMAEAIYAMQKAAGL